jgi:hypothetical protein
VRTKQFESPSFLPNLDALDAEFESKDEQYPTGRRRQGSASMDPVFRPTQSEFSNHPRAAKPSLDATKGSSVAATPERPSFGKRGLRGFIRLLIIFCAGVGTTLAWQSYGDAARAMIANSSPQLAWLAPATAPDAVAPAVATSSDMQRLAFGLAAVRQSVDQLTAQFAAGQQQTGGDIAKVQADTQEILLKLSTVPAQSAAAPPRKPAPVSASAVAAPPRKPAPVSASAPPAPSVQEPCGVRHLGDPFSTCFP